MSGSSVATARFSGRPRSAPDHRAGLTLEMAAWQAGYRLVAGADEAGRGAWAGPLVAAAVILPADPTTLMPLLGAVDDSKRLTPAAREHLLAHIRVCAQAVGIGSASAQEVDALGVTPANRLALRRAVEALAMRPDYLLLDFFTLPDLALPQQGVVHGDARSLSIAAASIVAKVTRDRWMADEDQIYPGYGFARHKGYGVAAHAEALARLGPCALHRLSFRPVAACLSAHCVPASGAP